MRTSIVVLSMLLAGAAHAQTPTVHFGGHTDYDLSESEPHQGFAADLDHDGNLDLVMTTTGGAAGDGRINVFYGDGTGDFSDNQALTAGHAPWGVGSGDFDNDGWLDLVAAESGQPYSGVYVWRNNHNGTFTLEPVLHTLGTFPIGVASGDFDQDGKVDLAVACNTGGYGLTTFHGNGNGTFATGQAVSLLNGFYGTRLVSGDFNGDGKTDLAEAHYSGVRVLLGNGAGGFTLGSDVGADLMESVSTADLNGDGVLDLATVGIYSDQLRTWHGTGSGTFTLGATLVTGDFPRDVVPYDLTGDGVKDLIVPAESLNAMQIFLGTGGGNYLAPQSVSAPLQPREAICGDWDGDGLADLAAPCRNLGDTPPVAVWFQSIPAPSTYCTAKTNSQGCTPAIGSSGAPSATSAASFLIGASQVLNNKAGLLFYGFAQASSPFQGGTMCVGGGVKRTPVQSSGGNASPDDCSGTYSIDMNVRIQSGVDAALEPGIRVYAQYWSRDPADAFFTGLTNGLTFAIRP